PSFNATFAIKGLLVALEPFLAKSKGAFELKDFYPGAIDYFRWENKLWALPNYSGPGVYYYNTALLKQRGLADPWELFQNGRWTIQQLDDAVQKLTTGQAGQGDTKVFGRNPVPTTVQMVSPWVQGFGGDVWNTQVTETLLHQEGSVKAWEYAAGQLINGYA